MAETEDIARKQKLMQAPLGGGRGISLGPLWFRVLVTFSDHVFVCRSELRLSGQIPDDKVPFLTRYTFPTRFVDNPCILGTNGKNAHQQMPKYAHATLSKKCSTFTTHCEKVCRNAHSPTSGKPFGEKTRRGRVQFSGGGKQGGGERQNISTTRHTKNVDQK